MKRTFLIIILGAVLTASFPGKHAYAAHSASSGGEAAAQAMHPVLQRGARGPTVQELQRRLNVWIRNAPRVYLRPLPVTGYFGPLTEQAVTAFQAANGLAVTGVVDHATWVALPADPDSNYCDPSAGLCFTRAWIYLIALGDAGRSGKYVGCGDSAVRIAADTPPNLGKRPLTSALIALLAIKTQIHGESGMYNALYLSDLRLEQVVIQNRTAIIDLSGDLRLGGACDTPRLAAQLEETALQFPTVDAVKIYLNGTDLDRILMDG